MDLDPKLTALAAAAIAPTKFLVDIMALSSPKLPSWAKPLIAFWTAFLLMLLYVVYIGTRPEVSYQSQFAGLILGAIIITTPGAVLLTEVQKRRERTKRDKGDQS